MYLRYSLLVVANLAFTLLSVLGCWLWPLFALGKDHLPGWLSWFDTYDNPITGDVGFQSLHAPFVGQQTGWKRYVNTCAWLFRNPGYTFDRDVLGIPVTNLTLRVESGDPLTGDCAHSHEGTRSVAIIQPNGRRYFWSLTIKRLTVTHCWHGEYGWRPENGQLVFSPRFAPWVEPAPPTLTNP